MANTANITERGSDGIAREAAIPASQPGDVFPAGAMLMWPYTSTPTGWLRGDGSEVSRATYPTLHTAAAADGYPDGAGNGTTTFNLPNYTDKSPIGAGNLYTRGSAYGAATVTLGSGEIPSHAHGINAESPGTGTESADHVHSAPGGGNFYGSGGSFLAGLTNTGGSFNVLIGATTSGRSAAHTHTVNSHSHGGATAAAGGGGAHANLHPVRACYIIIRAY